MPVVTASDFTATHNQNIAASDLFLVTDAGGDSITQYQLWDSTSDPASGHWIVNGVVQGSSVAIDVTAAQLASTPSQSGSGSDDLWVRASDGFLWSDWKEFHVNAPVDHAPVATASDFTAFHNQNILASSLFSVTDADGDFIAKYQVWDSTSDPSSGQWSINGVVQGTNVAIDVTAAQLASTTFQSGSGSDDLWVRASDGFLWSDWKEFHVNAPLDQAPVVIAPTSNFIATHNENIPASSLFWAIDADGDIIAKYQVWDSTADPASGHWVVDGVAQGANAVIDVTAAQSGTATFQSGSGADQLYVRANDGALWSTWQPFTVTAPIDQAPVVTAPNAAIATGQSVAASSLFTASDPDGDTLTKYEFYDATGSGHFVGGAEAQTAATLIDG